MRHALPTAAALLLLAVPAPAAPPVTDVERAEAIQACAVAAGTLDRRARDRKGEERYTLTGVPVQVTVWDDAGVKKARRESLTIVYLASPRDQQLMRLGFEPSNLEVCDAGADGILSPRKGGELHPDSSCKAFGSWAAGRDRQGAFMPFWPDWVAEGKKRTEAYEVALAKNDRKAMERLMTEGERAATRYVETYGRDVFSAALEAAADGVAADPRCKPAAPPAPAR